jgi:hypothetical protein
LAYVLDDLEGLQVLVDWEVLEELQQEELLVKWRQNHTVQGEHMTWWTSGPRCQIPIPSEYLQEGHWTLPNVTGENVTPKSPREEAIRRRLTAYFT